MLAKARDTESSQAVVAPQEPTGSGSTTSCAMSVPTGSRMNIRGSILSLMSPEAPGELGEKNVVAPCACMWNASPPCSDNGAEIVSKKSLRWQQISISEWL
jgi:hypothetical protein